MPTQERLASPRGRIDMHALATAGGVLHAELPCRHHVRSSDHVLNRLVLAGLELARRVAADLRLKTDVARLAKVYAEFVSPAALSEAALAGARRALDRQVAAYEPAVRLVELLYRGNALSFDDTTPPLPVPGFLFDMNRFFQALMARFLHDHLQHHVVNEESVLSHMMRYLPAHNPRGRRHPRPRPDFVITRHGKVKALLDAKYRDLWETDLPRDMLYQLAMYALSQPRGATAAILYPTMAPEARDALVEIRDPVNGGAMGYVALRPVVLTRLAKLVRERAPECDAMALVLAMGRSNPRRDTVHRPQQDV